jgi:hypothetical protein
MGEQQRLHAWMNIETLDNKSRIYYEKWRTSQGMARCRCQKREVLFGRYDSPEQPIIQENSHLPWRAVPGAQRRTHAVRPEQTPKTERTQTSKRTLDFGLAANQRQLGRLGETEPSSVRRLRPQLLEKTVGAHKLPAKSILSKHQEHPIHLRLQWCHHALNGVHNPWGYH